MKIIPPLFCKIKFVFSQCGRLLITGLAVVRVIRHQVRPADGAFQHIEARDACAVRDAPPAVHPADRRMLAGKILFAAVQAAAPFSHPEHDCGDIRTVPAGQRDCPPAYGRHCRK